ncbi:retinol dehydrogenase 13-like [Chelonus insularis]|uniref:retinol dehydrogenase 13-like n=1 Tax=Chelonus insularis TaxID=460826 RepID=UPI0015889F80|nr:retinol dehydrogenase 13-like [Chelonus insularis]
MAEIGAAEVSGGDLTIYYLIPVFIFGTLLALYVLVRLFNFVTLGICTSTKRLDGKTVILTGCTSGIGKETARDLAKRGARLIMACRNVEAATKLKDEFVEESGNNDIVVRKLDLASFKSIREFAEQIIKEEQRLDVLIHNAGIAHVWTRKLTEDGLELSMGTNMYGPFLLTNLLIDLLKKSAPSRIVLVGSESYLLGWLDLDNPNPTNLYIPGWSYFISKYALIVFMLELARRLEGTKVTVNSLHPGAIFTEIWYRSGRLTAMFFYIFIKPLCKSVVEGIQTTIYLAVSEEVEGVSGKHFLDCRKRKLYRGVTDRLKGIKYWQICKNLTKMQPSDPQI